MFFSNGKHSGRQFAGWMIIQKYGWAVRALLYDEKIWLSAIKSTRGEIVLTQIGGKRNLHVYAPFYNIIQIIFTYTHSHVWYFPTADVGISDVWLGEKVLTRMPSTTSENPWHAWNRGLLASLSAFCQTGWERKGRSHRRLTFSNCYSKKLTYFNIPVFFFFCSLFL